MEPNNSEFYKIFYWCAHCCRRVRRKDAFRGGNGRLECPLCHRQLRTEPKRPSYK